MTEAADSTLGQGEQQMEYGLSWNLAHTQSVVIYTTDFLQPMVAHLVGTGSIPVRSITASAEFSSLVNKPLY